MYAEKFRKFSDRRKYKLKHDIEEYSKIKYIGSLIYYKLLIQNSEELCDPLGYKMVNDNAEEIFDGVDAIGDTRNNIEASDFSGLYQTLPTCATQDTTVNTLICISSTKEQEISGQGTNRVNKVRAVNGLRIERNELNIRIWSMRQGISKLNDEYEDLVDLESYIGITTVKNLLDE